MLIVAILSLLALLFIWYLVVLVVRLRTSWSGVRAEAVALGAVVNFFDALGIGSFAPMTAYLKFRRLVPDDLIPPTMIVGVTAPTVVEAFAYINIVEVDPALLVCCIVATSLGSLWGVVTAPKLPLRLIRTTMGVGLLIAAVLYALSNLGQMPQGGVATALPAHLFVVAVLVSALLGVLINLGIGNFAPTMIMFAVMGMDPRAAFPIMMGAGAFLLVTSGIKIIRIRQLDYSIVLGLAIGGVPGVLVATYIVRSLPLETLRWLVVVAVAYAGLVMLHAATRRTQAVPGPADPSTDRSIPGG